MRIKQKLLAGFLFVSLLIFGFSFGISVLVQQKTVATFQEVGGEFLPGNIALSRIETELYHTMVLLNKYEKTPDIYTRHEMETALSNLDTYKTTHDLYHGNDKLSSQIEKMIQSFSRKVAQYVLLLQKISDKKEKQAVRQSIDSLLEQFTQSLNPSIEESIATSYEKILEVEKMNHHSQNVLLAGGAFILFITFLVSIYIAHLFSRPLQALRDAAQQIGAGNLDHNLPVISKDEIGDLAQAFNKMAGDLGATQSELEFEHQKLQEHKEQLEELVDARTVELRKLSRAVEQSHSSIFITDLNSNIEFINPAFTHTSGYSHEEAIGRNPRILCSEEYDSDFFESMWNTLKNGEVWQGELHSKRKDGSLYWESTTITPLTDETGKATNYVAVKDDITARKEVHLELEQSLNQLASAKDAAERANQSKSEFLSNMSHELRSPMNAILGFAQMLEYDEELNEEQQDYTHEILKAGKHLLDLINEVLDLAKIESGHIELSLEPVKLINLVDECFSLITPVAERRDVMISHGDIGQYHIRADRTRFKQVLINLLSNAIKYNCEQGKVELEARPINNDTEIRITITDTGDGIDEEKLEELFKPFNRLDAENSGVEGTGIGLTITKTLMELMGGRIGVESQKGNGCRFWVELAMESDELHDHDLMEYGNIDSHNTADQIAQNNQQYTILYIEDNPANLKLVSNMLAKRPHIKLITAHLPELGLEFALSHRPALILLDINMPGMNGYQILSIFQADERLKQIPVIAVTANAMPRDIKRGKEAGFSDYLTKPLMIPHFLKTINKFLK